jgi:hypothetical protein
MTTLLGGRVGDSIDRPWTGDMVTVLFVAVALLAAGKRFKGSVG